MTGGRRRPRRDVPKVVQIGFNRAGTRSLCRLFSRSGLPGIHQTLTLRGERVFAAKLMADNLSGGRKILSGIEHYDFFSDLEYFTDDARIDGYKYFKEIERDYPDTLFILNLRDKEGWLSSRRQHNGGSYLIRAKAYLGVTKTQDVLDAWAADWDAHIAAVRGHFAGKASLIEFDIKTDPIERLIARLPAHGLDPAHWAHVGARGEDQVALRAQLAAVAARGDDNG